MGLDARSALAILGEADRHGDLADWSEAFEVGVTRAIAGQDTALLRVHDGGERVELRRPDRPALQRVLSAGLGSLSPQDRDLLYRRGPAAVAMSELFPAGTTQGEVEAALADLGAGDIVGLTADPGLSVMILAGRVQRLDTRQRQTFLALVQHAAASVAVREARSGEASLDHELPARLRGALEELDRRQRAARRRGGAADAASALAFLTRLAEEGFAVVHEERRGRRHRLVAVRVRDPSARSLRTLDVGERRVVDGLRRGLSAQEIAYELDIAEATVSGRIRRIRAKLGIDPRSDVVRAAAADER